MIWAFRAQAEGKDAGSHGDKLRLSSQDKLKPGRMGIKAQHPAFFVIPLPGVCVLFVDL